MGNGNIWGFFLPRVAQNYNIRKLTVLDGVQFRRAGNCCMLTKIVKTKLEYNKRNNGGVLLMTLLSSGHVFKCLTHPGVGSYRHADTTLKSSDVYLEQEQKLPAQFTF
ncbi:hypothetical protein ACJX0J_008139, partial [Zea mays]